MRWWQLLTKTMSLTHIKTELNKFDKIKLVEIISDLYKKNKSVREYFEFFINPDEGALFKKYRDKVFEGFFPKRGYELKLKDSKQAISNFKKIEPSAHLLADLMLFYVECGVKFTNDFGDIDKGFYSSVEKMYLQALEFMRKEGILDKFQKRALKIIEDTNGIGWGFHDNLGSVFFDYYSEEID